MKSLLVSLLALGVAGHSWAGERVGFTTAFRPTMKIRYGVFSSDEVPAKGDVLYLHGYGDTFTNHKRLFAKWNSVGLRVVAFDLPSHGGTVSHGKDDLNHLDFDDLAKVAAVVEAVTRESAERPLLLAGWSTGGLVALRMVQTEGYPRLGRAPKGLVLFAPAVAVPMCVGNAFCHITNATLTHDNTLFSRFISPPTPLLRPVFGTKLLKEAARARADVLPKDLPTLVWVAGDHEDHYVKTSDLKQWVSDEHRRGAGVRGFQCAGARHELDNEVDWYGGIWVRNRSADFARTIAEGAPWVGSSAAGPCSEFQ